MSATERAICEELRLGRVSVASSGLGSQEDVDPEYQCPICLVRDGLMFPATTLFALDEHYNTA